MFVNGNMILYLYLTYKNAPVLCQSICACLHQTINMVGFISLDNKNHTKKGEHLCKYTVVPQTKKGILKAST